MHYLKNSWGVLGLGFLFSALSAYFLWSDLAYLSLISLALLAIYFAIYYTEQTFLALAFFTPLSVNIEEYVDGFGLFLPTEPILFGLMILLLMIQANKGRLIDRRIWQNPIVIAVSFYLFWTFVTCVTSTHPATSFKFLLAKLWFIIPLLFFGPMVYRKRGNVKVFLWLFVIAMIIAISYTLVIHASYGFGEQEGHWVMWPFFKDHTIYGSAVAFLIPILFAIYFSKKTTTMRVGKFI